MHGSLYVDDDIVLCYKSKNMNSVERQLSFKQNSKLGNENGLKFSKAKTA